MRSLISSLFVFVVCFCLPSSLHAQLAPGQQSLRLAAASDLVYAFKDLADSYTKQTGIKIDITFGASGLLARQIEKGAPFDLYAAASRSYIDDLSQKQVITASSVHSYAVGHIGIYSASPSFAITSLSELALPQIKKIAIANPAVAPYGRAAKEALIGAHLWDKLADRLVFGENIQQTMQFAQSGNADAAIVSLSLGLHAAGKFVPLADSTHAPLVQAMGVVAASQHQDAALKFEAYVLSKQGQAILKKHGFSSAEFSSITTSSGAKP